MVHVHSPDGAVCPPQVCSEAGSTSRCQEQLDWVPFCTAILACVTGVIKGIQKTRRENNIYIHTLKEQGLRIIIMIFHLFLYLNAHERL